jgi:hypothetical protein
MKPANARKPGVLQEEGQGSACGPILRTATTPTKSTPLYLRSRHTEAPPGKQGGTEADDPCCRRNRFASPVGSQ